MQNWKKSSQIRKQIIQRSAFLVFNLGRYPVSIFCISDVLYGRGGYINSPLRIGNYGTFAFYWCVWNQVSGVEFWFWELTSGVDQISWPRYFYFKILTSFYFRKQVNFFHVKKLNFDIVTWIGEKSKIYFNIWNQLRKKNF